MRFWRPSNRRPREAAPGAAPAQVACPLQGFDEGGVGEGVERAGTRWAAVFRKERNVSSRSVMFFSFFPPPLLSLPLFPFHPLSSAREEATKKTKGIFLQTSTFRMLRAARAAALLAAARAEGGAAASTSGSSAAGSTLGGSRSGSERRGSMLLFFARSLASTPAPAPAAAPVVDGIECTVNGKTVTIPKGANVMAACDAAGVDIPRYVFLERRGGWTIGALSPEMAPPKIERCLSFPRSAPALALGFFLPLQAHQGMHTLALSR